MISSPAGYSTSPHGGIIVAMARPLRQIRDSKALSQEDLAKESGLDRTTIIDLESGRRKPRPSTRRKLARALKVRVEEIEFPRREEAGDGDE